MKKVPYTMLSGFTCHCGKGIKANVANRKLQTPKRCYKCHCELEAGRQHTINTKARQMRVDNGLPVKKFNKMQEG